MLINALFLACAASLCVADNIRPCVLSDYKCIRDNLMANSKCNTTVVGAIPNQYTLPSVSYETPYFNASFIAQNFIIKNHDKCFVSEFFFSTDSKVVVIGVDCPNIVLESDRVRQQHNSLKQDVISKSHFKGTYPLVRFTMNVPDINGLDICTAFTFADVTAIPSNSNKIFEREAWAARAGLFMKYFINSKLCNFGCNK